MIIMQHPSTDLLASSPHILKATQTTDKTSERVPLPPKNATVDTIEDTYVQFILACNPGIPLKTDTSLLRAAFRTPPKSGGKSFSTWILFQLIAQFQNKEIKTWGELALKLGVEPPDQEKGQSSQKIQQYAVRLKRWMHSMHVDAFFEYLLENPHPYWTEIPTDGNLVNEGGRDGVAAEDDMALRSLLPHIKPRRGRKRPDDESLSLSSRSPSQKPRMDSARGDQPTVSGPGSMEQLDQLWAANPEARNTSYLFPQDQFARMSSMNMGHWTADDFAAAAQTPMTADTFTSMTPAPVNTLWSEQSGDARTGATPTRPKNKRHGAKVVSSAWRSGGPGGSGKTRGRPPLNRQSTTTSHSQNQFELAATQSSFSGIAPSTAQSQSPPTLLHQTHAQAQHASPNAMDASMANHPSMSLGSSMPSVTVTSTNQAHDMTAHQHGYNVRNQRQEQAPTPNMRVTGGRLSLQVPERIGGDVRLATPRGHRQEAVVMVDSAMSGAGDQATIAAHHQPNPPSFGHGMSGSVVNMMDPYSTAAAAAQSMYNMQFHQPHHQQMQHITQRTHQDSTPSFATTDLTHTHSSPPQPLFQQPTPGSVVTAPDTNTHPATTRGVSTVHFTDPSDRTNLDALEAHLIMELLGAKWEGGETSGEANIEEAASVSWAIMNHVRREAKDTQGFLMNLAAITGLSVLKSEGGIRVCRVGQENGNNFYEIHWELCLGDLRSNFSLRESVPRSRGVRMEGVGMEREDVESGDEEDEEDGESNASGEDARDNGDAKMWQRKYRDLLGLVRSQRDELREFRQGVMGLVTGRGGGEDAQQQKPTLR